jgi:hypothetical protein
LGYLPSDSHYPFAELTVCLGFFLIYAVETLTHKLCGGGSGHSHGLPVSSSDTGGVGRDEACCHGVVVNGGCELATASVIEERRIDKE